MELLLGLLKVSCSSCLVVWATFRDQGHDVVSFVFLFFCGILVAMMVIVGQLLIQEDLMSSISDPTSIG